MVHQAFHLSTLNSNSVPKMTDKFLVEGSVLKHSLPDLKTSQFKTSSSNIPVTSNFRKSNNNRR